MAYRKITVAHGDGIGPEIMNATLKVLKAAGAELEYDIIKIGKACYESGFMSGIEPESWTKLRNNKIFLKAPITTPQGGGYKSLNVAIRKSLGLYANVRPSRALHPYVQTRFPGMDLVVIRENEEDLYAGIEHQQTDEVVQCLKLISRPGSERVIRYAFEYAKAYGRRKVTCMTKDNIMKQTDGLFHELFKEVAEEYPDIEAEHRIIDIGTAQVAAYPEDLDVIVTLNLYGDIVSDITALTSGSVGLGGSANVGLQCSMFEAIHGSAPDIAGMNIANPSGLLSAAVMMLVEMKMPETAALIRNAWLRTLEDGVHTADIYKINFSKKKVGTEAFADAVVERLGHDPRNLKPVKFGAPKEMNVTLKERTVAKKELVGVDVFIDWRKDGRDPNSIGHQLEQLNGHGLKLKMITNRGVKVYPEGMLETFSTDHWRCRFISDRDGEVTNKQVIDLLGRVEGAGFDFIKTEHLYNFDGNRGYSVGLGE